MISTEMADGAAPPPSEAVPAGPRDDRQAIAAFVEYLLRDRGYDDAWRTSTPVDVIGRLGNETHKFEVKYTKDPGSSFGAATITEWEAALEDEERFWFVVASRRDGGWCFDFHAPGDFMEMSTIPPMKVYFHLRPGAAGPARRGTRRSAVVATRARLRELIATYQRLRSIVDDRE